MHSSYFTGKSLARRQLEYCIQVWIESVSETGYGKIGESAKKSHKNDSGLEGFEL